MGEGLKIDLDKRIPNAGNIDRDDIQTKRCGKCGSDHITHDIKQNKFLCVHCDGDKFSKPTLLADNGAPYKPQAPYIWDSITGEKRLVSEVEAEARIRQPKLRKVREPKEVKEVTRVARPKKETDVVSLEFHFNDLYVSENLPKYLLESLKVGLDNMTFSTMGEARKVGELQNKIDELLK